MTAGPPNQLRLTVAMLTFRRTGDLARHLGDVLAQVRALTDLELPGPAVVGDVLVVDNDADGSAAPVVAALDEPLIRYVVEPSAGIAFGRNRVLTECVDRELLVFIDDDERPEPRWLELLLRQWRDSDADAVGGKVGNDFEAEPEPWIIAGGYYGRRNMPTGTEIEVNATNNLLLDLRVVRALGLRFDTTLGLAGGEDTLFTRQLHHGGGRIVWCQEAVVTERVPANRLTRRFVMTRALSHGNTLIVVQLRLASGAPRRLLVRVRAILTGLARVLGGSARTVLGLLTRDLTHRARGIRSVCRGAGMLAAALGLRYREYANRRVG